MKYLEHLESEKKYICKLLEDSPDSLTKDEEANDMARFIEWEKAISKEEVSFLRCFFLSDDDAIEFYDDLRFLQIGYQTNSATFTLASLRVLHRILQYVREKSELLNLAPIIFEMIERPHANIDVTENALNIFLALSKMAYNLEAAPLLDIEDIQSLIARLKGSEYTKFMRATALTIIRYESRGCLEELKIEQQVLYKQVLDTTKDFYSSTLSAKFQLVRNLLDDWAHLITAVNGIPSSLMELYVLKINYYAENGLPWDYLEYLLDFTGEVGFSRPNSWCSHNDLLLITQHLSMCTHIMLCISIFKMDKNQIQEEQILPFLKLMASGEKEVELKIKDILVNHFPRTLKIHPIQLFELFAPYITDENDLVFFLNALKVEFITEHQVIMIFNQLPKKFIANYPTVLLFLLSIPKEVRKVLSNNENHDFVMNYLDLLHQQNKEFILEGYQILITSYYSLSTQEPEQASAILSRLKVVDDHVPYFLKAIFQDIQTPSRVAEILKGLEYPSLILAKLFSNSNAPSLLSNHDYFSLTDIFLDCLIEKAKSEPAFESTYLIPDSIDIRSFNHSMLIDVFKTTISSPYLEWRIFAVSLAKKFADDDRMKIYAQNGYYRLRNNLALSFRRVDKISLKTSGTYTNLQERLTHFSTLIMSSIAHLRSKWDEFKKIDILWLILHAPYSIKWKAAEEKTTDYSKLFSSYLDLVEIELNTNAELSNYKALSEEILEASIAASFQDDVIVKAIQISAKLIGSSSNEDATKLLINILESKINEPNEIAEYAITSLQETHSIVTLSQVEVDKLLKLASEADRETLVEKILLALLEAKGLTLPVATLYEIIEKLNSEKVHQKLLEEIRLSKFDTEESIDVKSAIELIAHISRKPNHEIKGKVFEAVINILKASNWDLDISLTGLRIIQNESTADAQMGQELISLMQLLETLEDERKIEIMALGMQILRASFNNFKDSITKDQVQFIDRTVAAAQSLNISNIVEKHRVNVLSPTLSTDIVDEPTASPNSTDTSSTSADKIPENSSEDSKETEERFDMLTRFKNIIIVKGKEILAEFIKPITSTALPGPTVATQNPLISSTNVVTLPFASALEVTNENKLNLGIAVGVPVGIIAFLATSFVLVRKCRKNKNSIAG